LTKLFKANEDLIGRFIAEEIFYCKNVATRVGVAHQREQCG